MIPVPNNMTSYLQPLDLMVNRSQRVQNPNRESVLRPLHAKWVVQFYDYMQSIKDIVLKG
ncbi:unnamed protein product [Porites lobata]|uniref:Uncharacterized protein n=1 Tax=Porites lobata TaxID=104759 RepID=A0ABN8PEG3_9CNID|nr:unnamed protein product [Porites lobata]